MCRVCEPGAARPCRNWNGQALCGGVHEGRDLWEHKERRGKVGTRRERWSPTQEMWGEEFSLRGNTTRSWDRREASAARWHDDHPGHSHGCVVPSYFMVWDYQMTLIYFGP